MRKLFGLLGIIIACYISSCDKGAVNTALPKLNLPDQAETVDSLDSTSLGVYKGVLAGAPGHVKIYINNGNTIVKAILALDSLTDSLSCAQPFVAGDAINGAIFTGRSSSFELSADAMGNNAVLHNLIVNGRSGIPAIIAHERSTSQVLCYEAAFTGTTTGQFNFLRYGSEGAAIAVSPSTFSYQSGGLVTGNIFQFSMRAGTDSVVFQGGIDHTRDYHSGSWTSSSYGSGVFSGKRVL